MNSETVYVAYYWNDCADGGSHIKTYGVFRSREDAISMVVEKAKEDDMDFEEGDEIDNPISYCWTFNGGEDNYVVERTCLSLSESPKNVCPMIDGKVNTNWLDKTFPRNKWILLRKDSGDIITVGDTQSEILNKASELSREKSLPTKQMILHITGQPGPTIKVDMGGETKGWRN